MVRHFGHSHLLGLFARHHPDGERIGAHKPCGEAVGRDWECEECRMMNGRIHFSLWRRNKLDFFWLFCRISLILQNEDRC